MLSLGRPPHPSHRPPGEGEGSQAAARPPPGGRLKGPRPRAARRAGGDLLPQRPRARLSPPLPRRLPGSGARGQARAPIAHHPRHEEPPRGPQPPRTSSSESTGASVSSAAMSELMLDQPPLPSCSGQRGRGGGGVAAAQEAHSGSARGCRGARREGAGPALRLRARLGGWDGASVAGLQKQGAPPERASRGPRRGRARGPGWGGGWWLRPAAPGGGGGGVDWGMGGRAEKRGSSAEKPPCGFAQQQGLPGSPPHENVACRFGL